MPDHVLLYYSGHNPKISNLLSTYEKDFRDTLNRNRNTSPLPESSIRRFCGIGNEYKAILLAVLLLQPEANIARQVVVEKLGIKSISDEILFDLKRPSYAKSTDFDFDPVDPTQRFWRAEGPSRVFLDTLFSSDSKENPPIRNEGRIDIDKEEHYLMYKLIKSVQSNLSKSTPKDLFDELDRLKAIGLLDSISIDVELNNGEIIGIEDFSDGQFQSIYIYTITELFKDENCIVLLDEPDSFLHPEWQFDFLNQIQAISDKSSQSNQVLMTSHSASTLLNGQSNKVKLLDVKEDKIVCNEVQKGYAIRKLSSELIKLNADKQILSVIHSIEQDRPILFTEGFSDPAIIMTAWSKLYQDEIPFDVYFGFGCTYLRRLLQDEKILGEVDPFPIFGLFDFDEAYNEWHGIKPEEGQDIIQSDPALGMTKKVHGKNSYAMLIPIPEVAELIAQAYENKAEKKTYKGNTQLEIEHLLYCKDSKKFFSEKTVVGGGKIIEFNQKSKMSFASDVVPTLDPVSFEVFRPVFEFILSKIQS